MTKWLAGLPDTLKLLLVGLGFGTAMFGAGAWTSSYAQLPDSVERNSVAIDTLVVRVDRFQDDIDDIKIQLRLANCMEIAERGGDDWRLCLPHGGSSLLPER